MNVRNQKDGASSTGTGSFADSPTQILSCAFENVSEASEDSRGPYFLIQYGMTCGFISSISSRSPRHNFEGTTDRAVRFRGRRAVK